jgi:HD superfamily phosphohydrolase YqeK
MEIWSDEVRVICSQCKRAIVREGTSSCLEWCKMGKECVGAEIYDSYMARRSSTVRQNILDELAGYFGDDTKRIEHAKRVLDHAEELLRREGGDWHIVIPASILHDVGIKVAEQKYQSAAGHYQEKEGPPVARKMLLKIGFRKEDIDEVCEIIAHHHSAGKDESLNFKILYDADYLENLRDALPAMPVAARKKLIDATFLTRAGHDAAEKLFLPNHVS